jgi:hypothetical protein
MLLPGVNVRMFGSIKLNRAPFSVAALCLISRSELEVEPRHHETDIRIDDRVLEERRNRHR